MKPGDKATLINDPVLQKVVGTGYLGKQVVLHSLLTATQKADLSSTYRGYELWYVSEPGRYHFWVPAECLCLESNTNQKGKNEMLFAVSFIKTDNDKNESLLVPTTEILAPDQNTALVVSSANAADAIKAATKDGSKLRVLVRQLG